jgi:mono/diheme cytochrome c family protein
VDLKKGIIYEKLSSSRRLARVWGSSAAAAGLVFCAISGFAQSVRTSPGANSAAGASVLLRSQGQGLFRQHCASCHYADSRAQKISVGLKGLYARSFSGGRKVTDLGLAKWIEEGGKDMPGFKETLKPGQVRALISYIKTL